jgi:hypothetical protein
MVGTGCAGIDIAVFRQHATNPAQRQVARKSGAGGSSANDEYLGVQ